MLESQVTWLKCVVYVLDLSFHGNLVPRDHKYQSMVECSEFGSHHSMLKVWLCLDRFSDIGHAPQP